MVEDAFSHYIDYVTIFQEIEEHPNCITGSKVKAILLNRLILPIGGASVVAAGAAGLFEKDFNVK